MNQKNTPAKRAWSLIRLYGCQMAAVLGLILLGSASASAAAAAVTITPIRVVDTFGLQWDAIPDALYRVQSATSLEGGGDWTTEEPVGTNSAGPVRWMAPEAMTRARFYRVLLPQPQIFSIEPSVLGTNGGTVYVIGQCLETNGTLRLGPASGGVEQPGIGDGHIMIVTLPPMAEGIYDASWLEGGQVIASAEKLFSIRAEVQPSGITQQLIEPPEESPSAPRLTIKQRVTKDYVGEMRDYEKEPAHVEIPNLRVFSGEVQLPVVDFWIPGRGLDFVWGRTYRSRTGTNTAMGNGWDHSYDLSAQRLGGDILIHGDTGRNDRFYGGTNGIYSAAGFFCEGTMSNNAFRLTFANTGFWEFNPFDSSPQEGKISRIADAHGNALTFGYDGLGRLTAIVDTLNRTNRVAYNSSGRIQSVTDFAGRMFSYEYYASADAGGSDGDLARAISPPITGTPNGNDFPGGKTNSYTYSRGYADDRENHLLLTVSNPKGQITHDHVYQHNQTDLEFLRCVSSHTGTNTPVIFHLEKLSAAPSNHFAVCKVIVNDALGNVTECFYDSRNRLVTMREFTGRAVAGVAVTDSANRPIGKLRSDDPDYFESQWTWNGDSLCAMYVNPRSIARQRYFESDYDPSASARKRGDVRDVREFACDGGADTDGDGIPDLTARAWHFAYDPHFGSPPMNAWRGWDGTIKGASRGGIMTKGDDVGMRLSTAQQTPEVTVRGWDGTIKGRFAAGPRQTIPLDGTFSHRTGDWGPSDWAVFNGSVWEKVDNSDLPTGRFATLDNCGNLMDSGRVICPTEDSGGGKPPRLVIDPEGNTFTYVLNSVGDLIHAEGKGRQNGAVIFADYDYSELGQLRYITNAPDSNGYRRVDAAGYYTNGPQNGYLREWTVDTQGPTLTTAYEYDSLGNVTRLITPRGTDWIFIRNTEGRCVRSQPPTNLTARCSTDYFYDAADNLVQTVRDVLDQNDSKLGTMLCVMAHDELDRCVSQATQVSSKHFITNRFVYDANGNLTASLSPEAANGHDPDNLAAFSYDERNLLFRKTQGPAGTGGIRYEYSYSLDCRARRLIVTDSTGLSSQPRVSTFGYDGFDRCVNVTDAMGNVTTRAYGALNELVYQRLDGETNDVPGGALNRRLAEIRYEYDFLSRPTHIHSGFFDPVTGLSLSDGESTVSFTYAPNSACISSTDDNGHTTSFGYDTVGRLTTITDAKANATTCAYDADGNVLSVSSVERADLGGAAEEFSRTFSYDALDRCVRWSDNVTNTVQYAYDSFGNCVRSLDARGHLSGASFDYAGRCTLAVADLDLDGALDFAADAGRTFTWDDNSRLIAVTDDNTNTTTSTYDSLNRWTLIQRPQGSTARRGYNTADNIETNIDANGTMVVASFDALDRCVRRDITPASGVIGSTTFETFAYDGQSRCVAASNDLSFVRFDFDSLGDCVRSTQDGLATACSFDGSGNCLSMTYPSRRLVIYTYDGLDQVSTIATAPFGQVPATLATWAYEGPHRVGRITRGNTVNTRITWDGFLNPANASGDFGWRQVSGVNHQIAGGGAIIDRRGCAYDQNQNKILRAQLSPFFAGGSLATNQFGYDSLDRLRLAINTKGASVKRNDYILDGNGNRQVVTNSGVPQLYSMDATIPPGDFQADQYTTTPFGSQQYDANGNLVFRSSAAGAFQYKYDYADRLVEVDSFATGTAQPVVSFSYDAIGRRISKTDYPPAPAAPVTTQFIYDGRDTDSDGDGILEERVSGIVSRVFCWGRNDRYQEGGDNESVRCPIAIINPSGQPLYTHADELGNALALTDATGHVLERYDYDDYGFPTFLSADGSPLVDGGGLPVTASPQGNPFLFHGMFWDEESGLYCSSRREPSLGVAFECKQAMFVDPATGRRTSRSRSADGLVFNVVNPRAARLSQGSGCASGDCLGQSDLSFSGDNPWSARAIYTEWAAGPRHYDDLRISDCDDHDPKRHHPSACRTTLGFGVIVVTGDGADLCAFQNGDRPTQAQFASLIDSMVHRSDDRRLIGLRQYDPGLVYSPGDTTIYNSSLYKPKAKPITFPKTITGHVTLIK